MAFTVIYAFKWSIYYIGLASLLAGLPYLAMLVITKLTCVSVGDRKGFQYHGISFVEISVRFVARMHILLWNRTT